MAPTDGEYLAGNVGGVVRTGGAVHRPTGPWTPAVHALLRHLDGRVPHIPRVLGVDGEGREVLTFLPGDVGDNDAGISPGRLTALAAWTREFHRAVDGFTHPGPWRYPGLAGATLIGHNDIAPYNACFAGDDLVGVFDWDLAGPATPLAELAFLAWNGVPLWRATEPGYAAERLTLVAEAYGGPDPRRILGAVPARIQRMLDGIPVLAAAGDQGMANLVALGEPVRSQAALDALVERMPAIDRVL